MPWNLHFYLQFNSVLSRRNLAAAQVRSLSRAWAKLFRNVSLGYLLAATSLGKHSLSCITFLLLGEWNVCRGAESTTCALPPQPYGVLCHRVITFRAVIWCLGFIPHATDEEYKALCYLYSFAKGKNQICSLTNDAFFYKQSVPLSTGDWFWDSEQKEMFCGCLRYIFWHH